MLERKQIFPDLFNIKSAAYVQDPYQCYAEVRTHSPVYKTPFGVYVLTRYRDIEAVLSSKKLTKNYWGSLEAIYGEACHKEAGFCLIAEWLTNLNPPNHTKIRKLITAALSTKKIAYLTQSATIISDQLIDDFYEEQCTDIVQTYAFKLPALVICHLLGIPKEDFEFVFKHVNMPNTLLDPVYHSRQTLDKANASVIELKDYFARLCIERQKKPGDDLISILLKINEEDAMASTSEEVVSNIFFLFGSGYETTMNLICNALYTLYAHPESLKRLLADWTLLPQILEEVIRFQSPVQVASPSLVLEDIVIDNYVIPKGKVVIPILGAANRDPEEYSNPNTFDIDRKPTKLLAFGFGPHLCLGSHLARLEVKVAIKRLLKRIPHLKIENLENPKWKPHVGLRALAELKVTW